MMYHRNIIYTTKKYKMETKPIKKRYPDDESHKPRSSLVFTAKNTRVTSDIIP